MRKIKYDFLIFGAGGMQGKIVIKDLLEKDYNIFVSDIYQSHIDNLTEEFGKINYEIVDLRNIKATINLIKKVKPFLVINCAEADWNLTVYKACLKNKVHIIDLGSDIPMTKKQLAMDSEFRKQKLIAITGCGSTPGINNIMLDYAVGQLDSIHTVEAGFAWNSNIKEFVVPFSIPSIIEEFIVPATMMKNGKWYKKNPLQTIKGKRYQGKIGRNKIFLVRHPEPYTFYFYYKDKGLKNIKYYAGFPTHSFNAIHNFIKLGLASPKKIKINEFELVPLEFLTEVLRKTKIPEGYKENEVLWVQVSGKKNNKRKEIYMECMADTLPGWEDAGCNIDTGIPASIIAQMITRGQIKAWGSFAPEGVVPKEEFFKALKEKNMDVYMNSKPIN